MKRPLLFTFRRCPYAMRARMALLVAGVPFDAQEVLLRDKPVELLALSPKATVPVLVLADGAVLDESLDIARWAFEGRDPQGWWLRAASPSNVALVALNDGAFKQQLDRYKYAQRHEGGVGTAARDAALGGLLQSLERRLLGAPFLGGDAACAADLAIFPFVRQFRAVDAAWFDAQALPATQRWLMGWLAAPVFEACMRKLPSGVRFEFR